MCSLLGAPQFATARPRELAPLALGGAPHFVRATIPPRAQGHHAASADAADSEAFATRANLELMLEDEPEGE